MIKRFEKERFRGFTDVDTGRTFENLEFDRCEFTSSSISMGSKPELRSTIRNVSLHGCRVRTSFLGAAILDNVQVRNLETGSDFFLEASAAVFRHVHLVGTLGRFQAHRNVGLMRAASVQQAFDSANAIYYRDVDWAMDISSAEFYECDVRGVPYQLIKRDSATQVVVTRERAMRTPWRELEFTNCYWDWHIAEMLKGPSDGVVLVAPKAHSGFQDRLRGLEMLRSIGAAEPK